MLSTVSSTQIVGNIQAALLQLLQALENCNNLQMALASGGLSALESTGISNADAQALLSGLADAAALYQIYQTGLPPATYPQAPLPAYVYGTSQRNVLGPVLTA